MNRHLSWRTSRCWFGVCLFCSFEFRPAGIIMRRACDPSCPSSPCMLCDSPRCTGSSCPSSAHTFLQVQTLAPFQSWLRALGLMVAAHLPSATRLYGTEHRHEPVLATAGLVASMSRKGNCYDNATMESFWSTLKTETGLEAAVPISRRAAELIVFDYIETFYNRTRRHSSLDYRSPVAFENQPTKNDIKAA